VGAASRIPHGYQGVSAEPSRRFAYLLLGLLTLSSCGGGGQGELNVAPTYSVGGYVTGLVGSGLTVSYNGGAPIAVSHNGAFTGARGVATGTVYSVAIVDQPMQPAQACTVNHGSGTVSSGDVTTINVYCPQAVGAHAYVVAQGRFYPSAVTLGTVSVYAIDPTSGALSQVPGSTVITGPGVTSFQFVPHSRFAWALSVGNGQTNLYPYYYGAIYIYTVDQNTALLTPVNGNPFLALNGTSSTPPGCKNGLGGVGITQAVTLYSNGAFGYAANAAFSGATGNEGTWSFRIDPATGAPLGLDTSVPGACGDPVTIDPSEQFAYFETFAAPPSNNPAGFGLAASRIDPTTGVLTPAPGSPWTIGGIEAVSIDPLGRFVYALDGTKIWAFVIDSASGALTPVAGSPFSPPSAPPTMRIEPRGDFAYVAGPKGLYTYSIDASTGALTSVGGPVALQDPVGPQIDPSGQFLYVGAAVPVAPGSTPEVGIYAYALNTTTGAPALVPGSPFAVEADPAFPEVMAITN
jgi:6-phosphogluconolactonase